MDKLTKTSLEKLPPHQLEAEQAVLGAVLLDQTALAAALEILSADDFYRDSHRKIFTALHSCVARGDAPDLLILRDELARRKELDAIGGPAYLAALVDATPTAANIEYHARLVRKTSLARIYQNYLINLACEIYDPSHDLDALVKDGKDKVEGIFRQLFTTDQARAFWSQNKQGIAADLDYDALLDFLEREGFFMLDLNDTSMFVRVTDHRLIQELKWKKGVNLTVKRFLKTHCRQTLARRDVWKLCNKTAKLFGNQFLTGLDPLQREFCRDTRETVFLFFQNGAVQITASTVQFLPYEQIPGLVWQENMSPHAYTGRYNFDVHARLKADLRRAIKQKQTREKRVIRTILSDIDHARKSPIGNGQYVICPINNGRIFELIHARLQEQLDAEAVNSHWQCHALARQAAEDLNIYDRYWELCQSAQKSEYEQVVEFLANDILEVEEGPEKRKQITVTNLTAYKFGLAHLAIAHNEQSNARCIVLADSNPTVTANGRRGKKILLEAFKYLRGEACVVKEDGKAMSYAMGDRFVYQMVKPNTKILIIDDVDAEKFNFKGFYSAITDGLVIESKGSNNPRWRFSFANNPKIAITSNDPVYGDDLSSVDRAILLPVSDHFRRVGQTPRQIFQHTLYDDWDGDEWNRFYDYFIQIIQEYLQRPDPSVIPIVDLTIFNAHKLMLLLPEPMIDYLDNNIEPGQDYVYDEVMQNIEALGVKFSDKIDKDGKNRSGKMRFTRYLHTYAQHHSYRLKKNTKEGRYLSHGVQYLCFIAETPPLPGMVYTKPGTT